MNDTDMNDLQRLIAEECDALKELLLAKNRAYGGSVVEPLRVFSKADTTEQIRVRIDDKLKRIQTMGTSASDEDTLKDLLGYLVILRVAQRMGPTSAARVTPAGHQWISPSTSVTGVLK